MLISTLLCCAGGNRFEPAVKEAVNRQMELYPKSTLKDLYKNFFQDKFGPGHLIGDTTAAGNYLRNELASFDKAAGPICEETGWEGRFYRVNLSVLKEELIPYPVFFDAFVRSVNGIQPIPVEEWKTEWIAIERVIAGMNLALPGHEQDKAYILLQLEKGQYVGHHSPSFEEAYDPHYRIISKDIFDKELRPFLD